MKEFSSIKEFHEAVKAGSFDLRQWFHELLTLIKEDDLNAWISVISEEKLDEYLDALFDGDKDLPLWGVPFAIKDNIDLEQMPTTAACREYEYVPEKSAYAVDLLIKAGAIPLGKTNMDQFATGLVGVRSPYGVCHNSINKDYVSGGSSSGSAVSVATGQVLFSLGTDTAGSGRVPAAFNNILGLKGTCGRVSNTGVVPACKSIDCLTVFARCTDDLSKVFSVMSNYDSSDPYARCSPAIKKGFKKNFVFGVPDAEDLQFFNDEEARKLFYKAVESLEKIGGTAKTINLRPFLDAAKLLYERSFVAERLSGNYDFFEKNLDKCLPVIQTIIGGSRKFTAADVFADKLKLSEYKKISEEILKGIDFVVTPTTGTIYKINDVLNDPISLNSNLGYYTNFMNLMDFCAVALPAGFRAEGEKKGLPFGITLFARAFYDEALLAVASEYTNFTSYPTGAKMLPYQTNEVKKSPECYTEVVVCGAHLKGMPLNFQLNDLGAEYVKTCSTSANYRMYLLDGTCAVKKPGLIRKENSGCKFEVEVYRLSYEALGYFLSLIPYPLGLGKVELEDGSMLTGFICEGEAVTNARDISEYGSFRKFMKSEC